MSQDKQFRDLEKNSSLLLLAEKKGVGHIEISYLSNVHTAVYKISPKDLLGNTRNNTPLSVIIYTGPIPEIQHVDINV